MCKMGILKKLISPKKPLTLSQGHQSLFVTHSPDIRNMHAKSFNDTLNNFQPTERTQIVE